MNKIELYSEELYGPKLHGEFESMEQILAYVEHILPEHAIWWTKEETEKKKLDI